MGPEESWPWLRRFQWPATSNGASSGRSLAYIEGWKAIYPSANRIFGFDGCRPCETVDLKCVCATEASAGKIGQDQRDGWGVSYVAKVRVVVFGGENRVTREGVGSGHGIDADLGTAHESAVRRKPPRPTP